MLDEESLRLPVADLATLDVFPDVVWVAGADGVLAHVNVAWQRLTGEPAGATTGETFAARLHPDDLEPTYARWRAAVAAGSPFVAEYRVRDADGRYRWLRSRGSPIRENGRVTAWIGTMLAVDDERAARDRQELLAGVNALFARVTDPDAIIDALLTLMVPRHADYCAIDLFDDGGGFERVVTSGPQPIREAIAAARERYAHAPALDGTAWHVARTGEPIIFGPNVPPRWSAEAGRVQRDLGVRSAVVVPLADGAAPIGAISLGRVSVDAPCYDDADLPFYIDLAARAAAAIRHARTTRELIASEQRYRTLADASPQLIGVKRADGALLFVNQTWHRYTGIPEEGVGPDVWGDVIHPDDREGFVAAWRRATEDGRDFEIQYRLRRHDGAYRWFLNRVTAIRDADGNVVSWIGTATDIDERKRAEDALRLAVEVGTLFAGTLDTDVALQQLADVAVRHLADWCGVYVYDGERRLRPLAIAHGDPAKVRFIREYLRRFPTRDDDVTATVAATGTPRRIDSIPPGAYDAIEDADERALAKSLGLRAVMAVPLAVEDERYGALTLALAESDRTFTDEDERLAMLIAQRASIALSNARLFERQRDVARTLQASFLPSALPAVDGAAFDAVYVAGTRDLTIGGDWYDAFAYDATTLGLSVGDVAGHGLEAAVLMGKMRQAFRALAVVERDPAYAVAVADSVLRREHPDVFVTAFVAAYDLRARRLQYTLAGHPAPFVRDARGGIRRLAQANVPLGIAELDDIESHVETLERGDLLVAFSDGLIETTHDIDEGERRVAAALAHAAFAICSAPARLLRALTVPSAVGDDVVLLCMRAGGGPDWSFDATDPAASQAAREAFVARLAREGIDAEARLACEIVFGELLGNAARYAPGTFDVGLRRTRDRLVLCTLDRGPGFAWTASRPDDDSESGRGLFLIETLGRDVLVEHLPGFGTYCEVMLPA